MNELDRHVYLKVQDIVEKLINLDCTLLGNKDDAWIMELLFKPGFHRCHLIEWILSKFGYKVGKIIGPQNSAEKRVKNLNSAISDLGLCQKHSKDIIEGTAPIKEQLEFWCTLVEITWLKHEIASTSSNSLGINEEGTSLTPHVTVTNEKGASSYVISEEKLISEECETVCSALNKFCESDNILHIFKHNLQLIAPDVELEIAKLPSCKLKVPEVHNSQINEDSLKEKTALTSLKDIYKNLCENTISINIDEGEADSEIKLNELEEELCKISSDFVSCTQGSFNDVYEDLKPLMCSTKTEDFSDVGPTFQKVETVLQDLVKFSKSFAVLESSNSKLMEVNSELEGLLNQEKLSDENYVATFNLLKD